jgi:hypothetical protein
MKFDCKDKRTETLLDGVIAVPDDRGVTQSTTCRTPSPGTGRLEPE